MEYIENISVTLTQNVKVKDNVCHLPLIDVFKSIKHGAGKIKSAVEKIKNETCKDKRNYLKVRCLPVFIPTGEFTKVADCNIVRFNGVICLDIDNVKDFNATKEQLKVHEYVLGIMKSPSENMKIFVLTNLKEANLYKAAYHKLGKLLELDGRTDLKFDTSCSNISHPCFFSYDPNIYINNKVQPLSLDVDELKKTVVVPSSPITLSSTIIPATPVKVLANPKNIREAIVKEHTLFEKHYSMSEGQRNANLFILASFLKDAGVPENYAIDYLVLYYNCKGFEAKEIATTVSSAYK